MRVPLHIAVWATLLAIVAPKRFLRFQHRVTKPRGIPAASDDNTVMIVSHGFRKAALLVCAATILGWLVGIGLTTCVGPPSSKRVATLQIFGAVVLLLATIYLRGAEIETWDHNTLIERVDRWIYCAGYVLGTAAIVASLTWM